MYIERLDINCRPKNGKKKSKAMTFLTNDKFPLLPVITIRDADKYNSKSFSVHWLFFHIWTLSSPGIAFEVTPFDSHRITAMCSILYLRFAIIINLPYKFSEWVSNHFNRDVIQQRKNGTYGTY